MGRIIAIDYGKKRTGLAVSDPMKVIAGGLTTVSSPDVIAFIKEYIKKEAVDLILLGEPRQMNYEPSENMQRVEVFKEKLIRAIPSVTVKLVDERFTSSLAHQAMRQGGLKKKDRQNKALVDELSAVILLQSYLETIRI
ncbi:MAG: Holliday junction resolvase RuvX [Dysgonamonadaceae bacterium]|jgi:putative Holliday junction resolvase|nr:Holliday junction resolvase RuvX [Dysgonamonadaceae bacterium]